MEAELQQSLAQGKKCPDFAVRRKVSSAHYHGEGGRRKIAAAVEVRPPGSKLSVRAEYETIPVTRGEDELWHELCRLPVRVDLLQDGEEVLARDVEELDERDGEAAERERDGGEGKDDGAEESSKSQVEEGWHVGRWCRVSGKKGRGVGRVPGCASSAHGPC